MPWHRAPVKGGGREPLGRCGEGGIRTLDTAFGPYNGLANRRLRPLGHLSKTAPTIVDRAGRCKGATPITAADAGRSGADAFALRWEPGSWKGRRVDGRARSL